jgi:large subunit ribosomal protein L14e
MFDVGRMCLKVAGREAGKYCVVVKKLDANFVLVTGPKSVTQVKRRKCNILHLEPLKESLNLKEDASDEEVIKAYEEASIFSKLDLPKPAHRIEQAEEKEEKPEKKKSKKKEEAE